MMNCANMMHGMGGALMMGGLALEWIILLVFELLGIAALIKYLSRPRPQ